MTVYMEFALTEKEAKALFRYIGQMSEHDAKELGIDLVDYHIVADDIYHLLHEVFNA